MELLNYSIDEGLKDINNRIGLSSSGNLAIMKSFIIDSTAIVFKTV